MKFTKNTVTSTPEMLKRRTGAEILTQITIASTAFTDGVCKAGSPISAAGVVANTADAIGILLYDVYDENPNASLIRSGCVNTANAQANSGITLASAAKTAMSHIIFE